jgi:hypothetical protein
MANLDNRTKVYCADTTCLYNVNDKCTCSTITIDNGCESYEENYDEEEE